MQDDSPGSLNAVTLAAGVRLADLAARVVSTSAAFSGAKVTWAPKLRPHHRDRRPRVAHRCVGAAGAGCIVVRPERGVRVLTVAVRRCARHGCGRPWIACATRRISARGRLPTAASK